MGETYEMTKTLKVIWTAGSPSECGQYFQSCVEAEGELGGVGSMFIRSDAPELLAMVDAMRPFARSGKLFPEPPGTVEFDQCIYNPAAGTEYSLCGDNLRAARIALTKWETLTK